MRWIDIMNLDDLLSQTCPWLLGGGEENDIVISSRIRFSRNLVGFPFPVRATVQDRRLIQETIRLAAEELFPQDEYCFADIPSLEPIDRTFLHERQLISRELVEAQQAYAVLVDRNERFGIIINEKDHLQIFSMQSGFVLQNVWRQIDQIDDQFGSKLDYVFHEKYGFLTSNVTNVGTGMKISVMLHLPALVATRELDKVFRTLQKAQLTIRGYYGENSQPLGDFFQMGNRSTLGKSEEEFIVKMLDIIPQVVSYERQARNFLCKNRREILLDRCSRSVGVLQTAQTISLAETMLHLSSLRLGIATGLLSGFDITTINSSLLHIQPAHLQKMQNKQLPQVDQDTFRATYLRQRLGR